MTLLLGKRDSRPNAAQFHLQTYLPILPIPPHAFGHEELVTEWPMLANDTISDSVIAAGLHATQLWNAEARTPVTVDEAAAIATYSAVSGYDPAMDLTNADGTTSNTTDTGTDMELFARYWRTTGLPDTTGARHKIGAYLALRPGDPLQLYTAIYLFGAVMVGLRLPETAEQQFIDGHVLDVVPGADTVGGHCVLAVARNGFIGIVTWGQLAWCTPRFLQEYCDEAYVCLTEEMLHPDVIPEGFNLGQLTADLARLDGPGQLR